MTSFHGRPHFPGHPHHFPSSPVFFNAFFNPFPFFFSPFFFPTFGWWGYYPPLTFSDFGCPYDDYNYQRQPYDQQQPYYQPDQDMGEQGGEAEQPSDRAEAAPNAPSEQVQPQAAPFDHETPLPDVIEWGKAGEAVPQKQPAPAGKGPVIVNLPHHTLTVLVNDPSALTAPAPQPPPPDNH